MQVAGDVAGYWNDERVNKSSKRSLYPTKKTVVQRSSTFGFVVQRRRRGGWSREENRTTGNEAQVRGLAGSGQVTVVRERVVGLAGAQWLTSSGRSGL